MATRTSKTTDDDTEEIEATTQSAPEDVHIETMAISTKETDYLGRALVTPASDSHDFLGRATTATTDHLGRLLLDA